MVVVLKTVVVVVVAAGIKVDRDVTILVLVHGVYLVLQEVVYLVGLPQSLV